MLLVPGGGGLRNGRGGIDQENVGRIRRILPDRAQRHFEVIVGNGGVAILNDSVERILQCRPTQPDRRIVIAGRRIREGAGGQQADEKKQARHD
jgi:hypothetical protein